MQPPTGDLLDYCPQGFLTATCCDPQGGFRYSSPEGLHQTVGPLLLPVLNVSCINCARGPGCTKPGRGTVVAAEGLSGCHKKPSGRGLRKTHLRTEEYE